MKKGEAPARRYRVNLGLQTDASWAQCEAARDRHGAAAVAVVDSNLSRAWFPTNQSELAQAVREATKATKNWPHIMGTTYSV